MTGVVLLFLLGLVLMIKGGDSFVEGAESVSYTHLTLPTICSV